MIVTEQEAKTKQCQERFGPTMPVASPQLSTEHANPYGHSLAGWPTSMAPQTCLGSGCMAWRWHQPARDEQWKRVYPHSDDRNEYLVAGYEVDPDDGAFMRIKIAEAAPATGYCGKAGRP